MLTVLTALIAFVGGVAAVSVKGWIDYRVDALREAKATRAAARLVASELRSASAYLSVLRMEDRDEYGWWPKDPPPFETPAWDEYRYLLAGSADPFAWSYIDSARRALTSLDASYRWATDGGTNFGRPLTEQDRMLLDVHVDTLKRATEKLSKLEDAPLPFDGWRRLKWSVLHPVRAAKLWRTNRAYRKRKAAEAVSRPPNG